MNNVIYTITCPITKNIVYVGKALYLPHRKSVHLHSINFSPIGVYISELKSMGLEPAFEILDSTYDSDVENYWIEQMRQWGFKLLNVRNYIK